MAAVPYAPGAAAGAPVNRAPGWSRSPADAHPGGAPSAPPGRWSGASQAKLRQTYAAGLAVHQGAAGKQRQLVAFGVAHRHDRTRARSPAAPCAASRLWPDLSPPPTTATSRGPSSSASATASPHPMKRGARGPSAFTTPSARSAAVRWGSAPVCAAYDSSAPAAARPPRGRRVVGRVLRTADQPLGVGRRVVQRTRLLGRELARGRGRAGTRRTPARPLPRSPTPARGSPRRHPRSPPTPRVGPLGRPCWCGQAARPVHVQPYQQVGGADRGLHQIGSVEVGAGLGERGDRQTVPGGDHLVVPPGARPLGPVPRAAASRTDAIFSASTRPSGSGAESAVELGHHQTEGPRQVDLLLSLCDFGCFQSVRGRLDGGPSRNRGVGQAADC